VRIRSLRFVPRITFTRLMFFCMFQEDGTEMDVDAAAPATQIAIKHGLPEIEIYCYLLVLIFLINQKKYDEVHLRRLFFVTKKILLSPLI
jgi:hypothetical protein